MYIITVYAFYIKVIQYAFYVYYSIAFLYNSIIVYAFYITVLQYMLSILQYYSI